MNHKELTYSAIELLKSLIQTPSFSSEEDETGNLISQWLTDKGITWFREKNNVWAKNKFFDASKPTVLLNSHHDTVRPNKGYARDPFDAAVVDGRLYGLGSNDAGGCLVSLMALFAHFYEKEELKYNLILAATAEEESSGKNGLNSMLQHFPEIAFAVVGEPTLMDLAIAEKGLLVLDAYAPGKAGHAAHPNSDNAIYNAIRDIQWIRSYEFPKVSEVLGKVKMTVTQIAAGEHHNVVPATCHFVVDCRVNEHYSNEAVFEMVNSNTKSKIVPRSFNLNSSSISIDHEIVQAGIKLGRKTYGSPTLSDQAVLSCPSLKLGPGDSTRSHSADEFIYLKEIEEGIDIYVKMFEQILR